MKKYRIIKGYPYTGLLKKSHIISWNNWDPPPLPRKTFRPTLSPAKNQKGYL
jgi:hypothetical protein